MTAKIILRSIKDSDGWGSLIGQLGLTEKTVERFFKYGEYADLEIEVDSMLRIVGGRILPKFVDGVRPKQDGCLCLDPSDISDVGFNFETPTCPVHENPKIRFEDIRILLTCPGSGCLGNCVARYTVYVHRNGTTQVFPETKIILCKKCGWQEKK